MNLPAERTSWLISAASAVAIHVAVVALVASQVTGGTKANPATQFTVLDLPSQTGAAVLQASPANRILPEAITADATSQSTVSNRIVAAATASTRASRADAYQRNTASRPDATALQSKTDAAEAPEQPETAAALPRTDEAERLPSANSQVRKPAEQPTVAQANVSPEPYEPAAPAAIETDRIANAAPQTIISPQTDIAVQSARPNDPARPATPDVTAQAIASAISGQRADRLSPDLQQPDRVPVEPQERRQSATQPQTAARANPDVVATAAVAPAGGRVAAAQTRPDQPPSPANPARAATSKPVASRISVASANGAAARVDRQPADRVPVGKIAVGRPAGPTAAPAARVRPGIVQPARPQRLALATRPAEQKVQRLENNRQRAENDLQRAFKFLKFNQSRECLTAMPSIAKDKQLRLSGYALARERWTAFFEEFQKTTRLTLPADLNTISRAQCKVLEFTRKSASYPSFSVSIDLDKPAIRSGGMLIGTLRNVGERHYHFLLVDDDGIAHNITQFVEPARHVKRFALRVNLTSGVVQTSQLLLLIVTDKKLQNLDTSLAVVIAGKVEDILDRIDREARERRLQVDLAIAPFHME